MVRGNAEPDMIGDPVVAAIERHRRAYDAFISVWSQTPVVGLYDRARVDEGAASALRRFRELDIEEEAGFSALHGTRPATKASANHEVFTEAAGTVDAALDEITARRPR
jgi:hypothetical protein